MPADFSICSLPLGDTALVPLTDRAETYLRQYRKTFGVEALTWEGRAIFVETSRDPERLDDATADLRAAGLIVR